MKSKKSLFTLLLAALSIFLFATETLSENPGFDDKEIRIAQFGPQTGPAAPWGAVARGAGLLFQIVNEEGGIHGRKSNIFRGMTSTTPPRPPPS
jgi:ABC-type branched-subunit amino acid transport system substrate-binding protein